MTYIDPAAKLYGHLPRLAMLGGGEIPPPINVEIDLSNRCSLGCEWCHFAYTHTRGPLAGKVEKPIGDVPGGDLMSLELAKRIIDQLAAARVDSITWTGGGEPTLHPDFAEIIRYARGKVQQGIYTHGAHIAEKRYAGLLRDAMTFVYVSLDAADAEAYKRDKGVDRFQAACDGVRALRAAEGEATIGVGYLVTERNYGSAGAAARLYRSLGADYVQFRPTIAYEQVSPDHPAEDTAWIGGALKKIAFDCQNIYGISIEIDEARFREYQDWHGHGYQTCWWSGLQSVITPNGNVWTCVNKREHPASLLGDLSQESWGDVWARRPIASVDHDCRVLCRGHLANKELNRIFADRPHSAFV